jgi:2-dehydropantoate 2-reductase
VVLLTTKSFDTEAALNQVLPLLDTEGLVISLQNGLGNIETISGLIGKKRTVGGRVMFGVEFASVGHFHVSVFAEKVMLGSAEADASQPMVDEIAQTFTGAGIPTEATGEIQKYLWSKVLFNCCLNALSVLLDTCYGKLGEQSETREIISGVIDEVFSLADRKNIDMGFASPDAYRDFFFNRLLVNAYSHHSSMLQDVKQGKRTEIDAINGAIVSLAEKEGIDTTTNRLLTQLVRAREKLTVSGDK